MTYKNQLINGLKQGFLFYAFSTILIAIQFSFYIVQGGRIKMRSPPKVLTGNFRPSQLSFFLS